MFQVAACTDVGMQRANNEDAFIADPDAGLFAVCDGMGGHEGGEVAARLAVESVAGFMRATLQGTLTTLPYPLNPALPSEANRLVMAIRVANAAVYAAAHRDPRLSDMGTTVAAALIRDGVAYVAHVGDSRVYRWRAGALELLTRDHSEINELVAAGRIRPEEAHRHPDKHVITRALGPEPDVRVTARMEQWLPGDVLLLCSDGLTDQVDDAQLAHLVTSCTQVRNEHGNIPLEALGAELVRRANAAGGRDNVTVVSVRAPG